MALFEGPIPFEGRAVEARSDGYTDTLTAAILARAEGSVTAAQGAPATAAVEMAAMLWGLALAAARVTPDSGTAAAVSPDVLRHAGREAIRRGQSLHVIDADPFEGVRLMPAYQWDVIGGPRRDTWRWRVTLAGPDTTETITVPDDGVVWLPWAVDAVRPWRGVPPMEYAHVTGALAANLELRLSQEAGAAVGSVIPVPQDGGAGDDDDPLAGLKADLKASRGGVSLVETTSAGWGEGKGGAPQADWKPRRFGADPPAALATLRGDAYEAVCAACGLPPGLSAKSDGTLAREGWRQFVMGRVEPLARAWAVELRRKLNAPALAFDFGALWAHDLAGRAGAFAKLTAGGMTLVDAAAASGVLGDVGRDVG